MRKRSGATRGKAKVLSLSNSYGAPATVEGDTTCLVVDSTGKRATIGRRIEKSSRPELLYKTLHLYVADGVKVGSAVTRISSPLGKLTHWRPANARSTPAWAQS